MQANGTETLVNVLAKSYRHLTLYVSSPSLSELSDQG